MAQEERKLSSLRFYLTDYLLTPGKLESLRSSFNRSPDRASNDSITDDSAQSLAVAFYAEPKPDNK